MVAPAPLAVPHTGVPGGNALRASLTPEKSKTPISSPRRTISFCTPAKAADAPYANGPPGQPDAWPSTTNITVPDVTTRQSRAATYASVGFVAAHAMCSLADTPSKLSAARFSTSPTPQRERHC